MLQVTDVRSQAWEDDLRANVSVFISYSDSAATGTFN